MASRTMSNSRVKPLGAVYAECLLGFLPFELMLGFLTKPGLQRPKTSLLCNSTHLQIPLSSGLRRFRNHKVSFITTVFPFSWHPFSLWIAFVLHLKDRHFIWLHHFRGTLALWFWDHCEAEHRSGRIIAACMVDRKCKEEDGKGPDSPIKSPLPPLNLLPPSRPYTLRFQDLPKQCH